MKKKYLQADDRRTLMPDKRIIHSKDFIFDWFTFKGQRENDGELDKGPGLPETGLSFYCGVDQQISRS